MNDIGDMIERGGDGPGFEHKLPEHRQPITPRCICRVDPMRGGVWNADCPVHPSPPAGWSPEPTMTRVDIREVKALCARIAEIDRIPFDRIEWMDGDTPLVIPKKSLDEFRFTGLANRDFVRMDLYKP